MTTGEISVVLRTIMYHYAADDTSILNRLHCKACMYITIVLRSKLFDWLYLQVKVVYALLYLLHATISIIALINISCL